MITLMFWSMGMMITSWTIPRRKLWEISIFQSSLLMLLSGFFFKKKTSTLWKNLSSKLGTDSINSPLMILSCWLIPVTMTASIKNLKKKSHMDKKIFITLIIFMIMTLIMTFSTTKLMMFFLGFESTLMPTLILITRWGMQKERMEAGYYFVFYTLLSSLPLFTSLLMLYKNTKKLKLMMKLWEKKYKMKKILASFCIMAFLVKIPMFGFHLWLPKAHVEAPVAGSMILAAILLKMGGYGLMRLSKLLWLKMNLKMSKILIMFCCWGGVLTSLMCLTQTDLKALMAYSSVSHMSFMVAAMSTKTKWAISGSMIMMMAHGLVSSALFFTAKMFYERSGTRTLIMSRGLKNMFKTMPLWWLIFSCAKLGLPPLPNSMGEVMMFSSTTKWKMISFMPMTLGMILTSMFSLSVYLYLNSGKRFKWKNMTKKIKERESMTFFLHILPLLTLIFNPKMIMKWPS